MATSASRITRTPARRYGGYPTRRPTPAQLSARVERLYVACVSFALGVAGTAIGFALGVVPYFRAADFSRYDWFFSACCCFGALAGFAVGFLNGTRWFRASEASPLIQRRMVAYMRRHGYDGPRVPQRTLNESAVRALLGTRRSNRVL